MDTYYATIVNGSLCGKKVKKFNKKKGTAMNTIYKQFNKYANSHGYDMPVKTGDFITDFLGSLAWSRPDGEIMKLVKFNEE